jgi:hypothetical protein
MRAIAVTSMLALALAGSLSIASAFGAPNIIIKVKGGKGLVSNNKEPGGCVTSTCKLVLGPHERLTLKAKPDPGYKFKRWEGPCLSTRGYKCTIEGSKGTERFVVRFGKG